MGCIYGVVGFVLTLLLSFMVMRRYMLIRTYECADNARKAEKANIEAREFFSEDYHRYVDKHGHHFTPELAEYASSVMHNADKSNHSWSCNDVKSAMDSLGIVVPPTSTLGDMTYTANMAYADFYPLVINDAPTCVLYSRAVAEDRDGYEGIQFYRWLADLMATNTKVDWQIFL